MADAHRWTSHPFARRRGRGLAVLAVILILATGLGLVTRSVFWGLFGLTVLFLSLEGFYFPTRHEMNEQGVSVARVFSRSTRPWESIRRVYEDRSGLTLSPYRGRRFLEPYRAIRLLFDGGSRDEIVTRVRASLSAETEWLSGR